MSKTDESIRFVSSKMSKKNKLIYKNFYYLLNTSKEDRCYWRCDKKSLNCRARLITNKACTKVEKIAKVGHNHPSQPDISLAPNQSFSNRSPPRMNVTFENSQKVLSIQKHKLLGITKFKEYSDATEESIEVECRFCSVKFGFTEDVIAMNNPVIRNFLSLMNFTSSENDPSSICEICYEKSKSCVEFVESVRHSLMTSNANEEIVEFNEEAINYGNEIEYEDEEIIEESLIVDQIEDTIEITNSKCSSTPTKVAAAKARKSEKSFKCMKCSESFDTKTKMKLHCDRVHSNNKLTKSTRFICEECGRDFGQEFNLQHHIESEHRRVERDDIIFTCSECQENFKAQMDLTEHLKIHQLNCLICSKTFKSREHLRSHKKNVHGPKRNVCDVCGKAFRTKTPLIQHMHIHTGVKAFICQICPDVAYAKKSSLLNHLKKLH